MKYKAFTLAEILIVLVIIGVLTMILLPVAFQSSPDEKVMKFKKANNTLNTVIKELVSSDKYYQDGDLGVKYDGTVISGANDEQKKYFCETFADVISTKSVNCSTEGRIFYDSGVQDSPDCPDSIDATRADIGCGWEAGDPTMTKQKEKLDTICASDEALNIGEEIVASDGTVFYQTSAAQTFGIYFISGCGNIMSQATTSYDTGDDCKYIKRHFGDVKNSNTGLACTYKLFCLDIDGMNKGEAPFGYGIRSDGKIITGKRADEWMNKEIKK